MTSPESILPVQTSAAQFGDTSCGVNYPSTIVCRKLDECQVRRFEDMLAESPDSPEVAAPLTPTAEQLHSIDQLANSQKWFACHAEHCLNYISWEGPISNWFKQLHHHLDQFEEAAVGANGGLGMCMTRAQMDLLSWQTRFFASKAPCLIRLVVSTIFLIEMTVSLCHASDLSCRNAFADALKLQNPSLHKSLVVALQALNIDEALKFIDECVDLGDFQGNATELLTIHLKAVAPTIKDHIFSLVHVIHSTHKR
jgi:hypothetical protein